MKKLLLLCASLALVSIGHAGTLSDKINAIDNAKNKCMKSAQSSADFNECSTKAKAQYERIIYNTEALDIIQKNKYQKVSKACGVPFTEKSSSVEDSYIVTCQSDVARMFANYAVQADGLK